LRRAGRVRRSTEEKLAVVFGLALRYSKAYRETIQRIHDGTREDLRVAGE
jgi:hypothetical protein